MRKLIATVESVLEALLLLIFTMMVISIIWQVFARYVLLRPTAWSEELARYLMVWTTMLGSALVLRRSGHVAVTVFVDAMPEPVQIVLAYLRDLLVILMAGYIAYYGYEFTVRGSVRLSSGIDLPMSYAYASLPVGGVLIALFVAFSRIAAKERPA